MSDTPRTDAEESKHGCLSITGTTLEISKLARQLERELAAMTAERDKYKATLKAISEYDGEAIWSDSRDDAARCMLDLAAEAITK